MGKRETYFNHSSAALKLLAGVIIIIGGVILLPGFLKFISFFVGGSLIYFSSKSLSRDPQLIFSNEGLFVGFKSKKTFHRSKVKSIKIKNEKVDFSTMEFIYITRYIRVKGKRQTTINSYPIGYLDIKRSDLTILIEDFMSQEFDNH